MPIYEYECGNCKRITEVFSTIYTDNEAVVCSHCGMCYARRIISMPASIKPDWTPYIDENISSEPVLVRGRGHRRELMKAQGLEEAEMSPQRKKEVRQKLRHIKRTGDYLHNKTIRRKRNVG